MADYYNWHAIKETLKEFQVKTTWLSSSEWMAFGGPHGTAAMRKANNIQPETLQLLLDKLGVDVDAFKETYSAYLGRKNLA